MIVRRHAPKRESGVQRAWPVASAAVLVLLTLFACAAAEEAASTSQTKPAPPPRPIERIRYAAPKRLATLSDQAIDESSGIACSRRNAGIFWTHNDSGGPPRLFAFDVKGHALGTYTVVGATNRDWEDLASFTHRKSHYLLIGDVGDNARRRRFAMLHLVVEPAIDPNARDVKGKVKVARTVRFVYEDGPQDCESVAVDPTTRTVYMVSKRGKRRVYELSLPDKPAARTLTAKPIATLPLGWTSAMDISSDGLRAVVLTYVDAYEYARSPGEKWKVAFARRPRRIAMPYRRQGESICFGLDGVSLYLTSEKRPTPLFKVAPVADRRSQ